MQWLHPAKSNHRYNPLAQYEKLISYEFQNNENKTVKKISRAVYTKLETKLHLNI